MIIGSKIIYIQQLTSTNTHAFSLLERVHPGEGTIVQTGYQTAGKGQQGNKWESETGKNLLFSIILYPSMITPDKQFILSMVISLGITDFLSRHLNGSVIKWPNDIYVNNDKIAGMLIENTLISDEIEDSVVGIGLNVNQDEFHPDARNAVSMKQLTGKEFELNDCLSQLSADLDKRYMQLKKGDYDVIKDDYLSRLMRFLEWHDYKDKNGTFNGRIVSVMDDGKLVIERKSGTESDYYFKEVEFIF
jgi:BirA family biotin operon repressor/biotin-[acetyl-CoA-carboxylase] ligase